ncbi:MAG: hypothetical protein N4A50_11080 [Vallitalea sp.]|nr:hypothetical protein [Vallitalea sp.]
MKHSRIIIILIIILIIIYLLVFTGCQKKQIEETNIVKNTEDIIESNNQQKVVFDVNDNKVKSNSSNDSVYKNSNVDIPKQEIEGNIDKQSEKDKIVSNKTNQVELIKANKVTNIDNKDNVKQVNKHSNNEDIENENINYIFKNIVDEHDNIDIQHDVNKTGNNFSHVLMVSHNIIGEYNNGRYYNLTKSTINIDDLEKQKFRIYKDGNVYEEQTVSYSSNIGEVLTVDITSDTDELDFSNPLFAISNADNIKEIPLETIIENNNSKFGIIVKKLLGMRGYTNTPAIIKEVIPIDIDNDGSSEYIINASNFNFGLEEMIEQLKYKKYASNLSPFSQIDTLNNVCGYNIILLLKENTVFIINERYSQLYDFQFQQFTEEEKNELVNKNSNLGALHNNNNIFLVYNKHQDIVALQTTYLPFYSDEMTNYLDEIIPYSYIMAVLDIDNDNTKEIIFHKDEDIFRNTKCLVLKYSNDNLVNVLEGEVIK